MIPSCITVSCELVLLVLVLVLALATSSARSLSAALANRTSHREALTAVDIQGCRVGVHKAPGSKASFILEPLLCWNKNMEALVCPGFDYMLSRHFLRVPVLLTDPAMPQRVKLRIENRFPVSVEFMELADVSIQLAEIDPRLQFELEEQLMTSEGRKYLMVRVYCSGVVNCDDIRQGLATHPSLLFERLHLSLSTDGSAPSISRANRSVSASSLQCQRNPRSALEASSAKISRSKLPADIASPVFNRTRLIELDGQLYFLVQQRSNGEISFQRNWTDYENGFGSLNGDFWIGLRLLHTLTRTSRVLRVELVRFRDAAFDQDFFHAEYTDFKVSQPPLYTLSYSAFNRPRSTTLGDALAESRGRGFSTQDRDNDGWPASCSQKRGGRGGWWFSGSCGGANPNGVFYGSNVANESGIRWAYLDSLAPNYKVETLKYIRILLRI